MVIGIGAFAIDYFVALLIPIGPIQAMGGIEMSFTGYGDFHDIE
jgi:hypothetical protein